MGRPYLDHNATSPLRPEVLRAVTDAMARAGNPSSVHAEGRAARALVERAREQVAALVGASPDEVVFTSGGSEANATILRPGAVIDARGRPIARLLVAATEHASGLDGHAFGGAARRLPVGRDGLVDPDEVRAELAEGGPALVSIQIANSETGLVQPVAALAVAVRTSGGVFHADAVQAAGRIPVALGGDGPDALSLSAHKLGGPMGIGALVMATDRTGPAGRLIAGGGQEARRRGGTENVPAIVGFGVAAEIAAASLATEARRLARLRDEAARAVRRLAPQAIVFGEAGERLPNTLLFSVPGLRAETALIALDLAGIAVSSGSACSSGKVGRSHVLAAMGVPDDLARGAIRLSFGWNSTEDDVLAFATAFGFVLQRLYERDAISEAA